MGDFPRLGLGGIAGTLGAVAIVDGDVAGGSVSFVREGRGGIDGAEAILAFGFFFLVCLWWVAYIK